MLFCELDGRVLGGTQLGLLVEVPLCEIDGRVLAYSLGCWWMLFCELDGARGHPAWAAGGGAALRDWRPGARGHAVWGLWMLFCELDSARGHPAWAAGGGAALRD